MGKVEIEKKTGNDVKIKKRLNEMRAKSVKNVINDKENEEYENG